MPLTRISLREGRSPAYKDAIRQGLYEAMRETFEVPENDRFMIVEELPADDFDYDRGYMGMTRTEDFVVVQLTVSDTRSAAQKTALFARIVEKLAAAPGIRPEDVFIALVEVRRENWSFGCGRAQYWEADQAVREAR